jgi:hypothetical protein
LLFACLLFWGERVPVRGHQSSLIERAQDHDLFGCFGCSAFLPVTFDLIVFMCGLPVGLIGGD